jgi:hypothetical protein
MRPVVILTHGVLGLTHLCVQHNTEVRARFPKAFSQFKLALELQQWRLVVFGMRTVVRN